MKAGTIMWGSLGAIAWTHVGYPMLIGLQARRTMDAPARRGDPSDGRKRDFRSRDLPAAPPGADVALVIAAHNEEAVIAARLENALALDHRDLEVIVSLDGSTDATAEIARGFEGVTVLENPRAGKVAAQNAGVRATDAEIVAFSDANSMWEPDALRELVAPFADPEVGYVCGHLRLAGDTSEGIYWRYEVWLRSNESRLGVMTAGNGAIYAVRRSAYPELTPAHSHDIGLPFRLARAGLRSVDAPGAVAVEPSAPTTSAEWERKVRMLARSWYDLLTGGMLDPRGLPPGYYGAIVSHRLLRYSVGLLHLALLGGAARRRHRPLLALHALWAGLGAAGRRGEGGRLGALAWYYAVVVGASLAGLARLLRRGPVATWSSVEGTR